MPPPRTAATLFSRISLMCLVFRLFPREFPPLFIFFPASFLEISAFFLSSFQPLFSSYSLLKSFFKPIFIMFQAFFCHVSCLILSFPAFILSVPPLFLSLPPLFLRYPPFFSSFTRSPFPSSYNLPTRQSYICLEIVPIVIPQLFVHFCHWLLNLFLPLIW